MFTLLPHTSRHKKVQFLKNKDNIHALYNQAISKKSVELAPHYRLLLASITPKIYLTVFFLFYPDRMYFSV